MKAVIVGGGTPPSMGLMKKRCGEADLVVAADAGAAALRMAGIQPHLMMGDFDSISAVELAQIRAESLVEVLPFNRDKDETDLDLCIREARSRGADRLVLLACTGTRLDHSLSNVMMLVPLAAEGISASIEDDRNELRAAIGSATIERRDGFSISLMAATPIVRNLRTSGLKWSLNGRDLHFGVSLGISNEFVDEKAVIQMDDGILFISVSKD